MADALEEVLASYDDNAIIRTSVMPVLVTFTHFDFDVCSACSPRSYWPSRTRERPSRSRSAGYPVVHMQERRVFVVRGGRGFAGLRPRTVSRRFHSQLRQVYGRYKIKGKATHGRFFFIIFCKLRLKIVFFSDEAAMYAYTSDTSRNKETFSRLADRYFDPHLCESLPVSRTSIKMEVRVWEARERWWSSSLSRKLTIEPRPGETSCF